MSNAWKQLQLISWLSTCDLGTLFWLTLTKYAPFSLPYGAIQLLPTASPEMLTKHPESTMSGIDAQFVAKML